MTKNDLTFTTKVLKILKEIKYEKFSDSKK